MIIPVKTQNGSYDITLERNALENLPLKLDRKVLIVTDDGVPEKYAKTVAAQCKEPYVVTLSQGESTKCFESFKYLLSKLVEYGFTRTDCAVAVGGGVMGDLTGFVASAYMRGIDFYNIPTTLLSQVDSSIGGKVAIDFEGVKNIVGAFYQPKAVVIDPDTLETLDKRQLSNGMAEVIKMALTFDADLFSSIEKDDISIIDIIHRSLLIKRDVVQKDEKESGLRKVLNFGHTLAHAVESAAKGALYHGECVAIGMLPMCDEQVRARLLPVLLKYNLPTTPVGEKDELLNAIKHDKKMAGDKLTVIYVKEIGSFEMRTIDINEVSL